MRKSFFLQLKHSSLVLLLFSVLSVPMIQANEPNFIRESSRARGMGNAFTAVANDEMALFYNPAGLRAIQNNIYEFFKLQLGLNYKLEGHGSIDSNSFNVNEGGVGSITGKNLYGESNFSGLSVVNSRWGYSLFGGFLVNASIHNPVFPYLRGRLYAQQGAVGAMAWSFMDYQLDFGVGWKFLKRMGVDSKLHFTDENITKITEGSSTSDKIYDEKNAIAPDAGMIYHFERIHNLSPKIAISAQNIGGMDFGNAGKIPMTINTGVATESELGGFDIIMAADYQDLLNGQKMASDNNLISERNIKIGVEVGWWKLDNGHHFFSFRLGRNGPYNSQGWTWNIWKLKIDIAKYSVETGGYAGEKEDKRWTFGLGLIF